LFQYFQHNNIWTKNILHWYFKFTLYLLLSNSPFWKWFFDKIYGTPCSYYDWFVEPMYGSKPVPTNTWPNPSQFDR